jgi:antitoxin VapB
MSIKNSEAEELARKLANVTGESLTGAIVTALRERLDRVERRSLQLSLADELEAIALRAAALPLNDRRSPEDIIGYDENGLPR